MQRENIEKLKQNGKIKAYQKYQNAFYFISIIFTPILLFLVVFFPVSKFFYNISKSIASNYYVVITLYSILFSLVFKILFLPYDYYRDFYIEKKFSLSSQSKTDFFKDRLKEFALSMIFALILINALYFFIKTTRVYWWLILSGFIIVFNVILARLYPVLIMPLFNEFKPLDDNELKTRIKNLMQRAGVKPTGFFIMDMSKRTKKANAFFTGIGKSKRVVLGDTLLKNYTHDEIELILAHEIGHFKKKHIYFGMILSVILLLFGLYLCDVLIIKLLPYFGFESLTNVAAFPLIALILQIFFLILTPLQNFISREFEKSADKTALELKPDLDVFESVFYKLSEQNLSDVNPSAIIKIMRYSHPPIEERINFAKKVLNRV